MESLFIYFFVTMVLIVFTCFFKHNNNILIIVCSAILSVTYGLRAVSYTHFTLPTKRIGYIFAAPDYYKKTI
ncbi:hypothetical protein EHW70_26360, partial [Escherichia coli]